MEQYSWNEGPHDTRTLPVGAFVQPIEWYHLPKHIKDRNNIKELKDNFMCYTRYGIVLIPKKLVRKVV